MDAGFGCSPCAAGVEPKFARGYAAPDAPDPRRAAPPLRPVRPGRALETGDLRAPLDIPELILAILVETERRIMIDLEGSNPDDVDDDIAKDSVAARIWKWLSTTEAKLNAFDIGVHGQKLTLELKSNPTFKQQVRATVKLRLTDFLMQARRHMAELEARAKRYHIDEPSTRYQGIVVVLDSLEKLRGLS